MEMMGTKRPLNNMYAYYTTEQNVTEGVGCQTITTNDVWYPCFFLVFTDLRDANL